MDATRKTPKPAASRSRERVRDRAQTEELMLAAAQRLFADRGFLAVSVRDIAAEAGVSHALIHRYLGSKEDILVAVMKRNTAPALRAAGAAADVREMVPRMFGGLLASQPDYLRLLARIVMDHLSFDAVKPEFPAYAFLIEALTDDAAQRGRELPDPRVLAASLTALAIGWSATEDWLVKASGLDVVDPQVIAASLELIVLNMVDAETSPAASDEASPEPPAGA
jgi:AcrR family transcriptional regulator